VNLNILPTNVMLAHGEQWLGNPDLRSRIDASQLGAALVNELGRVHERLSGQVSRRRKLAIALARLTDAISVADVDHDSLARALHFALEALIAGARDAADVERYRRLQALLFPEGLSIVSRTYSYEAGAIKALQTRVSAEDVAELATITVGETTLADWYAGWIASGQTLGRHVHEREALYTSAGRGGSAVEAVDVRAARLDWVGTVHTFVGAIGLMNLDQETRERILGPLEASIDQALRSRANRASDETPDDDLPDDELPGDELPGDDLPGDDLPGDDLPGDELPGDELPGDEPANS
jgi:hypothetical protein